VIGKQKKKLDVNVIGQSLYCIETRRLFVHNVHNLIYEGHIRMWSDILNKIVKQNTRDRHVHIDWLMDRKRLIDTKLI